MTSAAAPITPELEHGPALVRLATRLADAHGADDLVQSTWVRALEHRDDAVRSRGAWLRQVLRNEHRMTVRGRCRAEAREQAACATLEESLDPERIVEQRQIADIVAELVEELDDEIRRVVRLRYFEGHSAAEIARLHAVPAGTVRWRLKVGLDRLRQQFDARCGGKRALWAGAFAPVSFSPTLATGTASKGSMVATAAATTQGSSTMFVKSLIAKSLIGSAAVATAAGALALTTRDGASSSAPESSVLRAEEHPVLVAPPERRVPDDDARIRWAQRVEAVREARARQSQVSPTVLAPTGASGVCVWTKHASCGLQLSSRISSAAAKSSRAHCPSM